MNAPIGKNLEAACKAWAYQQEIRQVEVYCDTCGGGNWLVKAKDANRKHYCSSGCAAEGRNVTEFYKE